MELPLLKDVIIIFALSITVLLACHKIRIPTIVGFIITGIVCGPHGLGLILDIADVETLSKIGIVLLLYMIGMEFSIEKILMYKRFFLLGGALQVLFTVFTGFCIAQFSQRSPQESLFLGFLLSLSSTAIALRVLEGRSESNSPQGRIATGMLIFQDVIAVPMMLMIPMLSGAEHATQGKTYFVWMFAKGILLVVVVFFAAVKIVPKLFHVIARTRSRELFLLSVLTLCFAVAWFADELGLSLSIGAFLAGLIISETEYSNQALGDILPIQDIFTSFFFVSVGMLLDLKFVVAQPFLILILTFGLLALKSTLATVSSIICGMPLRTSVLAGIALCQIGEFSFVLEKAGIDYGIGSDYHHQLFLAVALFTMVLTPPLIAASPWIAHYATFLPLPAKIISGYNPLMQGNKPHLTDHVIIVGFGITGRNLARACKQAGISYLIIEMNADTVIEQRKLGQSIHFGDASHEIILEHAHIKEARSIAVVINDPSATIRITSQARRLNSSLYIITRTRYVQDVRLLLNVGADQVIPDEFGASMEILTHVLKQSRIPSDEIDVCAEEIRKESYEKLRSIYNPAAILESNRLVEKDLGLETLRIRAKSPYVGKSLSQSGLRKNLGLNVVMIKREGSTLNKIDAETILEANDRIVVVGHPLKLRQALELFKEEDKEMLNEEIKIS